MDQTELRTKLEQHHASAWGWALYCCRGESEEAREVLQTAYLGVLGGKARFDERSSFKTWFFAVIRRTASKQRMKLSRVLKSFTSDFPASASYQPRSEETVYRSELRSEILGILRRLSSRQQEVLHLVFYQDLTVEESARVMGLSVGSARTHYHRAKERLKQELKTVDIGL
jgi:RNA polymerase sigma-70 factor (ECF subfamily)